MKVSLDWLKQYVDISGLTPEVIAEKITAAGLEVEGIHRSVPVDNLVVGYVKEIKKHPDADKLNICTVFDGEKDFQIVCGAPNATAEVFVVLAKVGAVLPGDFKIKEAKIRGVESFGMLCSERELGLSENHEGIILLSGNFKEGEDANTVLGLGDTILEIGITPNRGDCLSIYGVARDVAAVFNRELKAFPLNVKESGSPTGDIIGLEINTTDTCPYFALRVIKGIKIGPSPLWMQKRLKSAGIRPISNVVDITNYVMLEYGQPMHAYDLRVIDQKIIVRNAVTGEKIETLDGKERALDESVMVIADASKVIGIAGVMGGEYSGINDDTVDVALECAYFTPQSVAHSARKYGINSDSSYRYIRGIDYGRTMEMSDYAARLIKEICGGEVCTGQITCGETPPVIRNVTAYSSKISALIGQSIPTETIMEYLGRLGMAVEAEGDKLIVGVPSHRSDITHAAGITEEVARLYGLSNIPTKLPAFESNSLPLSAFEVQKRLTRYRLADMGFSETINYSFLAKNYLKLFEEESKLVDLMNPLSEEMQTLRTMVFPGLIKALEGNWNQGERSIRMFDFATVFEKKEDGGGQPKEQTNLAMGIMGEFTPLSWAASDTGIDTFYYMKSVVDNVLSGMKLSAEYNPCDKSFLHPGKSASLAVNGSSIGFMGALHPDIVDELDLKGSVYIAELYFEQLLELASRYKFKYSEFSRFPSIYKDISVVVAKTNKTSDMVKAISSVSPLITEVTLFDIYSGKGIEQGEQSMTYRIYFSAVDKTLTDEEINPLLADMTDKLGEEFGAKLR